ncbi:Ig-like domain-containing protein [Winogradskyella sp.]|uniref:Ig-like domain-containing protein n=1 Tax=Winogradskyella sp. TaxID=1883156 RepID=UPI0025EC4282|nr:Ig-like domain-containing protein [Winogradskyella sp.]
MYLVFFCALVVMACRNDASEFKIIYEADRAVALSLDSGLDSENIKVVLDTNQSTPILGAIYKTNDSHIFRPVIPFTNGQKYLVFKDTIQIAEFIIDKNSDENNPKLTAIFPSIDTVPENLLKMYLQFSKPMQEVGDALDYVTVINETTGKEVDVFLKLNTELWNKEHTMLTLWLDPGRIKTDLIPNKTLGLPILKNNTYTIHIDKSWRDADGLSLDKTYSKTFNVVERDALKPHVENWEITVNNAVLTIDFKEPLDAILVKETLNIKDENGTIVLGEIVLKTNETSLEFRPKHDFTSQTYTISVDSKLEDLAGNNLNHLFDRDVTQHTATDNSEYKTLTFKID